MRNIWKKATALAVLAPSMLGFATGADAASGKVTASALHVRSTPSTSGKIIGKIYKNNTLDYSEHNAAWVKINFQGKTAYVAKRYVQTLPNIAKPAFASYEGKVTASALNVRVGIGTSHKIVGKLAKGTVVQVSNSASGWLYVTAGNIKGWVSGQYVLKAPVVPTAPVTKPATPVPATPAQPVVPVATDYKSMNLRYPSQVTASEINSYIQKYEVLTGERSIFGGQGQLFIDVATEAGINQLLFAAMAIHESRFGMNELAVQKYNLFSVGAYDADPLYYAHTFQSVEHAVRYQAKFLRENYLNPSNWRYKGSYLGDGNGGINYYYATDKQWGEKIAAHANKIHPFRAEEYTNIEVMSGVTPVVADPIKPPAKK
ncbi:SH3 domain-containing protein [Ectobacillus sp. JY-23]|uniref:SH3 domain-containing protein n=1 Tax=Ectobacillus sp. JY-23 TaxID=2933872 RepID=UPI001FF1429F|nr:SH3 domain-containing protein [Ectobacillus sp. JY-23]UOY93143.1 SH3 domain-containing protein [Ectobacillus sp. JY-23]